MYGSRRSEVKIEKCLIRQETDGVLYRLSEPFDFGFLRRYGRVFKVFDDQDSGNICFGLERDGAQYFLKFAGAHTARYDGNPAKAVAALQAAAPIYRALVHENLIRLLEAGEMGGGYGMLFEWTDAICMGQMYPEQHKAFMAPEEFERGAPLDEITNVYALGALAFALFADCSRTREAWELSEPLYRVAKKATCDERSARYPSLCALLADWENALEKKTKPKGVY